jgi:hypothetical protein
MTFSVIGFSQAVKDSTQVTDKGQRPKAEYKLGSAIITVWVNKRSDGTTWKNFRVKKIYKKDDKWLSSDSFSETELLELKAVIDKVISEETVTKKE